MNHTLVATDVSRWIYPSGAHDLTIVATTLPGSWAPFTPNSWGSILPTNQGLVATDVSRWIYPSGAHDLTIVATTPPGSWAPFTPVPGGPFSPGNVRAVTVTGHGSKRRRS